MSSAKTFAHSLGIIAVTTAQTCANIALPGVTGVVTYLGINSLFNATAQGNVSPETIALASLPPSVAAVAGAGLIGAALAQRAYPGLRERFRHAHENTDESARFGIGAANIGYASLGVLSMGVTGVEMALMSSATGARIVGNAVETGEQVNFAARFIGGITGAAMGVAATAGVGRAFMELRNAVARKNKLDI